MFGGKSIPGEGSEAGERWVRRTAGGPELLDGHETGVRSGRYHGTEHPGLPRPLYRLRLCWKPEGKLGGDEVMGLSSLGRRFYTSVGGIGRFREPGPADPGPLVTVPMPQLLGVTQWDHHPSQACEEKRK